MLPSRFAASIQCKGETQMTAVNADFWDRSLNRHLAAWAGKVMGDFPAYDFAAAMIGGVSPRDAAQEAIDVQAWVDAEGRK